MCLNERHNEAWMNKHLFDTFFIQNFLKKGDDLKSLHFNSALVYTIGNVEAMRKD
jgi:hypothetical protein